MSVSGWVARGVTMSVTRRRVARRVAGSIARDVSDLPLAHTSEGCGFFVITNQPCHILHCFFVVCDAFEH